MKFRFIFSILIAALMICMAAPTVSFADSAVFSEGERVFVGGFPVGISLELGGVLVESVTGVETEYGTAYVEGIKEGDIIRRVNGVSVESASDIRSNLTEGANELSIWRDGEELRVEVRAITEEYSEKPRLGINIKEKLYGIGTVSFIKSTGRYAALGHEIFGSETGAHMPFFGGKLHGCRLLGIKKGKRGEAGALLASLTPGTELGTVECNNGFGISGRYGGDVSGLELMPVADRSEVHVGAAKIKTTVSDEAEYYDIEIIKASKQKGRREKGIVFRVTDKRLLELSGGVVRGMSGSPIVQDGKLVGAVTHVFLNDFTKGYGVYADCLNG